MCDSQANGSMDIGYSFIRGSFKSVLYDKRRAMNNEWDMHEYSVYSVIISDGYYKMTNNLIEADVEFVWKMVKCEQRALLNWTIII